MSARKVTYSSLKHAKYIREYSKLRPPNVPHNRFFVNYQKEECTIQPVGRNKIHNAPKLIVDFLHLEKAEFYTGHSFRRTSATFPAGSGASVLKMKQYGGETKEFEGIVSFRYLCKLRHEIMYNWIVSAVFWFPFQHTH